MVVTQAAGRDGSFTVTGNLLAVALSGSLRHDRDEPEQLYGSGNQSYMKTASC